MIVTAVESSNFDLRYSTKKEVALNSKSKEEELVDNSVIHDIEVDKSSAREFYYSYKANDLMKSLIQTYLDVQEEQSDFSFEDIREFTKKQNRVDLLQSYQGDVRVQENKTVYEGWV